MRDIMKILFIVIYIFLTLNFIYSDDTYIYYGGGTIEFYKDSSEDIKLLSQTINIDLYDEHYTVDINFDFYNKGDTKKIKVGFPVFLYGTLDIIENPINLKKILNNFKTWVNNKEVTFQYIEDYKKNSGIAAWYIKEVTFYKHNSTKTRVRYNSGYGFGGPYLNLIYYYGSGSSWDGKINNIEIEVTNNSKYWILDIITYNSEKNNFHQKPIQNNKLHLSLFEIEPNKNEFVLIEVFDYPEFFFEYSWPYDNKILSDSFLERFTLNQLNILYNSFYASKGFIFKSDELNTYFSNLHWYKPNNDFDEIMFSESDKTNIQKIIKIKELRK